MQKYVVLEKQLGQTPLECVEAWRATQSPAFAHIPLAYAGRLDPMASGKLLILIGDECKRQSDYHTLDKRYVFQVLCGFSSDTGDVLGLAKRGGAGEVSATDLTRAATTLTGAVSLPYPHFSSKTVAGKPLFQWTLENRLSEITIPKKDSTIYRLKLQKTEIKSLHDIVSKIEASISTVTPVTEESKALGRDFRRAEVLTRWHELLHGREADLHTIATFSCIATSGTYMRTLASELAVAAGTTGLAYSIHRTHIGRYQPLPFNQGIWKQTY